MATPESQGFPQWAFNWAVGAASTVIAWFLARYIVKVDKLIESQGITITRREFDEMELRIATLASRSELTENMTLIRESMEKRLDQMRQDRLQMHSDNQTYLKNLRDDIKETRTDIRTVHERIDDVFKGRK